MDDERFERMLAKLLQADFSAGTESFRDQLLVRCLEVLNADAHDFTAGPDADCHVAELDDASLELLAAAGDVSSVEGPSLPGVDGKAFGLHPGAGA